ncbi:hypothetical protein [Gordonibacter massiliensis (ex Traore et al. 2017)]|uniref:hypothetical protein n=1 Tax=Gordonibacter massiliensis (ex Traore et al. 2017) TaxID=1841863 RepID=UPI001C8B9F7D|nr:hypothetical protein [Gordonibacter massiliensis (ex Traore et al. 2017)]MBX9035049.1 hypothetical protein [Gordonibacter massiliensis (ex Traore et al. 2017)]
MNEWMNNRSPDGTWYGDTFATREEAVEDGMRQHADALQGLGTDLFDDDFPGPPTNVFYVGRVVKFRPSVDGCDLIERAQQDAWDASEYGEGYLDDVTKEQADELDGLVSAPRDFYEAAEKARQYARDGMRKNDVLALIDLLEMHHKSDMSARRKNDTGK